MIGLPTRLGFASSSVIYLSVGLVDTHGRVQQNKNLNISLTPDFIAYFIVTDPMANQKASREVLFDNYTLQAAYGYIEDKKRTTLYEESLSNLIESIVVYDRIYVPQDVLERNSACRKIADGFRGIIVGKAMDLTPDLHHDRINTEIVNQFRTLLTTKRPFGRFETEEAYDIEKIGRPRNFSPVEMGQHRDDLPLSFPERHTYYAWYCVKLASQLGLNYVPNPTRNDLFNDPEFMQKTPFVDFRTGILDNFKLPRKKYAERVQKISNKSFQISLDLPLVYNYIKSRADGEGMITETIKLRDSPSAQAYREYCLKLENAFETGDSDFVDNQQKKIEDLAAYWSKTLTRQRIKKKITISFSFLGPVSPSISTNQNISLPNPLASDRKPHFVFLHDLISRID